MNPVTFQLSIRRHGHFSTTSNVLDEAIRYYSLANERQLQAVLVDLTDGTEDFSDVSDRCVLLVMICELTGNIQSSVCRSIPGKLQAIKIVDDTHKFILHRDSLKGNDNA